MQCFVIYIKDGSYDVYYENKTFISYLRYIFKSLFNRCLSFTYNVGIYFKHKHDPQIDFELDKISE